MAKNRLKWALSQMTTYRFKGAKMKFDTLEAEVLDLLERHPVARDDDNILYKMHLLNHGMPPANILDFYGNMSHYREQYGISSIETVGRCRRKIQEERHDLQPSPEAKRRKAEQQLSFIGYAKGGIYGQ